jgi:hypothetical protein
MSDARGTCAAKDGIEDRNGPPQKAAPTNAGLAGAESGAELFFQCGDDSSGVVVYLCFGQRSFAALEDYAHKE